MRYLLTRLLLKIGALAVKAVLCDLQDSCLFAHAAESLALRSGVREETNDRRDRLEQPVHNCTRANAAAVRQCQLVFDMSDGRFGNR